LTPEAPSSPYAADVKSEEIKVSLYMSKEHKMNLNVAATNLNLAQVANPVLVEGWVGPGGNLDALKKIRKYK
jgi:hypothetical protein